MSNAEVIERMIRLTQPALQVANTLARLITTAHNLSEPAILVQLTILAKQSADMTSTVQRFVDDLHNDRLPSTHLRKTRSTANTQPDPEPQA